MGGAHRVLSAVDRERLRLLASHLSVLESPGFSFGRWVPARTDADGVTHLGWYELSPAAEAFVADVRAGGWIRPFNWPAWLETAEGRRLAHEPDAVASASVQDLEHLLTAVVRSERFADGSMAGAYESGILTAVVRRAQAMLDG